MVSEVSRRRAGGGHSSAPFGEVRGLLERFPSLLASRQVYGLSE